MLLCFRVLASFLLILVLSSNLSSAQETQEMVKPNALKPGDTIMIVAPAGELSGQRISMAKKRLEEMGFKVALPKNLFRQWGYLAGPDEERAAELMHAFTNPEVDAVFPGTGGYGTMRMLDLLDYEKIKANPKLFIGFSDITGLHMALGKKCNLVTFHSPNPMWGLGSHSNLHPFSAKYFWRNLLATENQSADGSEGFVYEIPSHRPMGYYSAGTAEGELCGGNLTLVASLTGTDYQLETDGKILFLEDVREAPYRIDRMLRQMKLTGQLDSLAGVILGQFRKCENDGDDPSLTLQEVFLDYFGDVDYPVVNLFPAGHVTQNATLPFGVRVRISTDPVEVKVLENPVIVD